MGQRWKTGENPKTKKKQKIEPGLQQNLLFSSSVLDLFGDNGRPSVIVAAVELSFWGPLYQIKRKETKTGTKNEREKEKSVSSTSPR